MSNCLDDYKGLDVPFTTPSPGGSAIKENFERLVDWHPKSVWDKTANPTVSDDVTQDFYPGSLWFNTTTNSLYVCTDNSEGAAVWVQASGGGGGAPTLQQVTDAGATTDDQITVSGGIDLDDSTIKHGTLVADDDSLSVAWRDRALSDGAEVSVDWGNRLLTVNSSEISVRWADRILEDSSGLSAVDWTFRYLNSSDSTNSLGWDTRELYDNSGGPTVSLDWQNRQLKNPSSVVLLDWSGDAPKILTASSAPATPAAGMVYFNTTDNKFYGRGSSAWIGLGSAQIISVGVYIDGGGAVIATGSVGYRNIPAAATVVGWRILSDVSGSIVVDVKRSTYSGFPTTSSIAGTEKPTLSSARKNEDTSLSSWTTALSAGDILEFVVDSASTVTKVWVFIDIEVG